MPQSNLRIYGGNVFSYQTMIKQTLADGTTLGNVTDYSRLGVTTGRHQKLACVHSADILLDNVPVGCNDLREYCINDPNRLLSGISRVIYPMPDDLEPCDLIDLYDVKVLDRKREDTNMQAKGNVHSEDGKYYAIITLPNGHTYYSGAFNSYSAAYRYSVKENAKHKHANEIGMIYNTRGL